MFVLISAYKEQYVATNTNSVHSAVEICGDLSVVLGSVCRVEDLTLDLNLLPAGDLNTNPEKKKDSKWFQLVTS